MSQPAPTCFLPRQASPTRPKPRRKTPLHCARSGRACQLAGEGHTGRGHCPLARKAHPARASRVSALRAESPRSEGRCFGLEPKTTCAPPPLCIPRKGARLWLGGRDTHVTARPDLFFVQTGPLTRPGPHRKTPLHSARTGRASQLAGEGHTGRGRRPLAREAARRVVAAYAALRAAGPRRPEEGASAYPFGLGPNGCCHKTPLHCARPGWACQLAGESAPRWGSFCAAVQHLTFLRRMPPSGGRGCGVSAPARRVPFRMHEKGPKVHLRGDAP